METQEELEKRRDVVRTWLAEFESNYNKEFLEVVAEIQEADVKKDDKCLIGYARKIINDLKHCIEFLEQKEVSSIRYVAKIKVREEFQAKGTTYPDIVSDSLHDCLDIVEDFMNNYGYDGMLYPDIRIKAEINHGNDIQG
jgi:hypothetical protein